MEQPQTQHRHGLLRRTASRLRGIGRRLTLSAVNNVIVNNLAIGLGCEERVKQWQHPYRSFRPSANKSLQENAGFSDRPEINAAVEKTHAYLGKLARTALGAAGRKPRILDIGCGPGLYLRDFCADEFDVTGLDLNPGMCEVARATAPHARVMQGEFLATPLEETFNLVYTVGTFIYIGRTQVDPFFAKVARLLAPGGLLFLNYQHALSAWDLLYPDLNYIQYSPLLVERSVSRHLTIVEHRHAFDDRTIGTYDRTPYRSTNPKTDKTFLNSSVLIARKEPLAG